MTIREEVDAMIEEANRAVQAGDPSISDSVATTLVRVLADQVDDLHARISRIEDQVEGVGVTPRIQ